MPAWLTRPPTSWRCSRSSPTGPTSWVGTGPRYPWGGLYGGQIVAQALRAAAHTVEPQFRVHSLHAYFIRRGDHTEPVRYEVDRVRNGRSFVTRTVTARQAVGAILSMSVSFQVDEEAPEVQTAELPDVPGRPSLPPGLLELHVRPGHRARRRPAGPVPGLDAHPRRRSATTRSSTPARWPTCPTTTPPTPWCALRPDRPGPGTPPEDQHPFMAFSLDHAIWFHRPLRADQWHLTAMVCHGIISSRGLTVGHVFTEDGIHVPRCPRRSSCAAAATPRRKGRRQPVIGSRAMTSTLVLLRHGQSTWNAENLFTGWWDADLSEQGRAEAAAAGTLMAEAGIAPDVVHTSLQTRAIRTANLALDAMGLLWLPGQAALAAERAPLRRPHRAQQGRGHRRVRRGPGEGLAPQLRHAAAAHRRRTTPYNPNTDPRYAAIPRRRAARSRSAWPTWSTACSPTGSTRSSPTWPAAAPCWWPPTATACGPW